ncbi:MAG TPA: hypothetical protein VM487_04470 [Phycisphaerae bacterium]|nr:hypothetical protein [Phycisphaerae bacterium]
MRSTRYVLTIGAIAGVICISANATDYTFNPQGGDTGVWRDEDNWIPDNGPPCTEDDTATIPTGKHCRVEQWYPGVGAIYVAQNATLTITNGRSIKIGSDQTPTTSTIDGELRFEGLANPGLYVADAGLTIDGSGTITASGAHGCGGAFVKNC